jgi:hypothetical protein
MDAHQMIVAAVLATKSNAEMPNKARPDTMAGVRPGGPAPMLRRKPRSAALAGDAA